MNDEQLKLRIYSDGIVHCSLSIVHCSSKKQTWLPKTESHVDNMWIKLSLHWFSFWFLFYLSLYWASFCPLKNLHIYYTIFLALFQVRNPLLLFFWLKNRDISNKIKIMSISSKIPYACGFVEF